MEPYALFFFCGILPWTLVLAPRSSSRSGVLIAGGNLIKKVLFPAEVLPVVTVLANLVHFLLGLPILLGFLICLRHASRPSALLLPLPVLVQLVFTLGLALFVSALTVHFRDIQNILGHLVHLLVLRLAGALPLRRAPRAAALVPAPQPHVPRPRELPADPLRRPLRPLARASRTAALVALAGLRAGRVLLRPPARHPGGGSVSASPAIVARDLAKVYRRFLHQNQFRTLKSALLTGSLLSDLTPDQTFTALDGVSFEVPKGSTFGVIGENGSGKSTLLKLLAGITKPTRGHASTVDGPHLRPHRARRRLPPRDQRARERLHQRHHARPQPAGDRGALRRDRGVRGDASASSTPR